MKSILLSIFLLLPSLAHADSIEKLASTNIPDLTRSEVYFERIVKAPDAVLVLCPGVNGNGQDWLRDPVWQTFAKANNVDLIGISFASEVPLLRSGRGYYYAPKGSGQVLLDAVQSIYHRDVPLLVYGFSGGAHFTSSFAEWRPTRIIGWCAYSAAWWTKPARNSVTPPGLIICGEEDKRLGASLLYFEEGRALGKPWLWLCAPKSGHSIYPSAENFVRNYFAAILKKGLTSPGMWVDIDRKVEAKDFVVSNQPSATGWLPDKSLLLQWREVHSP